jgi:hypothetical protein
MLPRSRIPSHPGIILLEEFLKPSGFLRSLLPRISVFPLLVK